MGQATVVCSSYAERIDLTTLFMICLRSSACAEITSKPEGISLRYGVDELKRLVLSVLIAQLHISTRSRTTNQRFHHFSSLTTTQADDGQCDSSGACHSTREYGHSLSWPCTTTMNFRTIETQSTESYNISSCIEALMLIYQAASI